MKKSLILALVFTFLFPLMASAGTYGVPWNGDRLGNLEIGRYEGREVSLRFRADQSGVIDEARIYLMDAPGYSLGDGGELLVEVQTDDGTSDHFPSGTTLASAVITDPCAEVFPLITFSPGGSVTGGELYHLVFSNIHADPVGNYISIDNLFSDNPTSPVQPGISDQDLAVLFKSTAQHGWEFKNQHTPIVDIHYFNGYNQGQGYMDALSESGVVVLAGIVRKLRETFTVSDGDRTVSGVNIRVKQGDTNLRGALIVALQDSQGNTIQGGAIPSSQIGTEMQWVNYEFSQNVTLEEGETYHLMIRSPRNFYSTYGLQEGSAYGFSGSTYFADGYLEYSSTFVENWQSDLDLDMQFYFDVEEEVPAVSPYGWLR